MSSSLVAMVQAPSGVGGQHGSAPPGRLQQAANEFEASLLQAILQPVMRGGSLTGSTAEGNDSGEGEGSVLDSYRVQALASALAQKGGLGLSQLVQREVGAEAAAHDRARQAAQGVSGSHIGTNHY
ncbi:MAG: hypothetical protein KGK08_07055 [Acidobacteriota bacterium]|nr:hypothetical protein [Acidobacteriota bacterium]